MNRLTVRLSVLGTTAVLLGVALQGGCGSEGALFSGASSGSDVDGSGGPQGDFGQTSDSDGSGGDDGCVNLQCHQVKCDDPGTTTTITGKVYDPAGLNPLYNALVYIPNAPVEPFDDSKGVTCDPCNQGFASGSPIVADITQPDGTFTLRNVPVGVPFPMVIQMGKWRRMVALPPANRCVDNPITDIEKLRLPRNQSEGHIPQMAITTGGADPFECLLRKIGLDVSEFSLPTQNGRVHMFKAHNGVDLAPDAGGAVGTPASSVLWKDPSLLRKYDVVLFPCESTAGNGDKAEDVKQTATGYSNVRNYVDIGGRLFVTHYSYTWLENAAAAPFPTAATWEHRESDRSDRPGANATLETDLDTSFPKGQAFSQWLSFVDASAAPGKLAVNDWRHDVLKENKPPSQRWITADTRKGYVDASVADANKAGPVVEHFTFNAPIEAGVDDAGAPLQCGKVVFSDFHVSAGERTDKLPFPHECKMNPMTPQEKALEFMLFDLSACIQVEDQPPPRPPIQVPK